MLLQRAKGAAVPSAIEIYSVACAYARVAFDKSQAASCEQLYPGLSSFISSVLSCDFRINAIRRFSLRPLKAWSKRLVCRLAGK